MYIDDGESYDYESGAYIHTQFKFEQNRLTCSSLHEKLESEAAETFAKSMQILRVERIHLLGLSRKPSKVTVVSVNGGRTDVEFDYDPSSQKAVIKDPKASVSACDWTIEIQ